LFFFSFFLPFCLFPVFHIFFLLSLIYFVYVFLSLWVVFFYCSIVLLNNYKICNLSLTYLFMHPIYIYSYFSYWQFLYFFYIFTIIFTYKHFLYIQHVYSSLSQWIVIRKKVVILFAHSWIVFWALLGTL
jgi:hypothetical protein